MYFWQGFCKYSNMNENMQMPMQQEILKDLQWWERYLPGFDGISIPWLQDTKCDQEIASDSSLVGAAAMHNKEYFHYKFSDEILYNTNNIAQRELFTVVIAVKMWITDLQGKMIKFSTDNQNALIAINKGHTRDPFMLTCVRELAWICACNQVMIKAIFVKSKDNKIPDALSRWYQSADVCRIFK